VHDAPPDPLPREPGLPPRRSTPASSSLPAPRFRYSPVVIAGGFAFVSGLIGLDPSTGTLADGDVYRQSRQILENFAALCDEHRWPLEDLVVARIYCVDFARFPDVNRAWEERFASVAPPARTSVGVSALPLGALVEMEFQLVVR